MVAYSIKYINNSYKCCENVLGIFLRRITGEICSQNNEDSF